MHDFIAVLREQQQDRTSSQQQGVEPGPRVAPEDIPPALLSARQLGRYLGFENGKAVVYGLNQRDMLPAPIRLPESRMMLWRRHEIDD